MVHKLPTNKEELVKCWGIKGKRAQQYGDSILRIINSYLQSLSGNNNQSRRQIQTTINFNPQSPPASQRTSNTRVASSTSQQLQHQQQQLVLHPRILQQNQMEKMIQMMILL